MNKRNIMAVVLVVVAAVTLSNCGTENTPPYGSKIIINPASVTTSGASGACDVNYWKNQVFEITVLGPDGNPMNGAAIVIALDWAPDYAAPTMWAMLLWDGGNPVTVPYNTITGDFGTKTVTVRYVADCKFKGQLEVFSGSAYAKADITSN